MYVLTPDLKTKKLLDTWIDSYHVIWNGLIDMYNEEAMNDHLIVPSTSMKYFIYRYRLLKEQHPELRMVHRSFWMKWVRHLAGMISSTGKTPEKIKPRSGFKVVNAWVDVMEGGLRFPGQELITSATTKLYISSKSDVIGYRVLRKAGKYYLYWIYQHKRR